MKVNLGGTATYWDGDPGTKSGTDYWTPIPAGSGYDKYRTLDGRALWFSETPSAGSTQAAALLEFPVGSTSVSFEIHVIDDAHEDSGETIEIGATVRQYSYSDNGAGETGVASLLASDTLTLTIVNHEDAETEAARLAAEAAEKAEKQRLAEERAAAGGPLSGLALTAGSEAVALVPAFSTNVLSYRAEVPAGTTGVSLVPSWGALAELGGSPTVHLISRGPATILAHTQVHASGTAAALALSSAGPTRLEVTVLEPDGSGKPRQGTATTYRVEVVGGGRCRRRRRSRRP